MSHRCPLGYLFLLLINVSFEIYDIIEHFSFTPRSDWSLLVVLNQNDALVALFLIGHFWLRATLEPTHL